MFRSQLYFGLFALLLGAEAAQATNLLTATPATATLTCNTATGVGTPVSVVVKP